MIIIPDKLRRPAEVERDELRKHLAEAQAEIENLKWRINSEEAKAEAALELNGKAIELFNEARTDAEHWKSECNALQRRVHEARAVIEHKNRLIEQMREALKLALPEARSTHCENTIKAALAAERGE
jgi:chromosome segregation ATPase